MRGRREPQSSLLESVDLETQVRRDHPLRTIKRLADDALSELSPLFDPVYADGGRTFDPA